MKSTMLRPRNFIAAAIISATAFASTAASVAAPTDAFATDYSSSQIWYASTNADNVCAYGYNQHNQYSIECLSIVYGWGGYGSYWWRWQTSVQIIWSWANHYLNTTYCYIPLLASAQYACNQYP